MTYTLAFLDKEGNVRPPETWEEVREMYCKRWDSCSPCPYAGGPARVGGGFECSHPLNPNKNK
jgi:hypothetical protein